MANKHGTAKYHEQNVNAKHLPKYFTSAQQFE